MNSFLQCWVICKKDLRVWLSMRVLIIATVLVPASYLLVEFLGAAAVGHNPVAVVNADRGSKGKDFVHALLQADVFRVFVVSSADAQQRYSHLDVAAIVTIPADFSARLQRQAPDPIRVQINNFNLDLTNDIRRAVPDAMTLYYAHEKIDPITMMIDEYPLRKTNVELFEYAVLPTIMLLVTVNGVISTGLLATLEWERHTIKELLLAPCPQIAIIAGKVLAGFLTTSALGIGMLVVGALLGWIHPRGLYWGTAVLMIVLAALCANGIGIAVGSFFRRQQPVIFFATVISIYLFALAGGVGVIFFEPQWLQTVAEFDPLTYAVHTLQMSVFYESTAALGRDVLVLVMVSLLTILLGSLALRRELVK